MRVLIYGGRDFVGDELSRRFLDNEVPDTPDTVIITGMARGADTFGLWWGVDNHHAIDRFPADWDNHGKAAGHIRNQQMLDSGIDLAIEFPGGRGTADMRRRLDKAGVKVIEYKEKNEKPNTS